MSSDSEDKLVRIQALLSIEAADTSAMILILKEYHRMLAPTFPRLPDPLERFLELRKLLLQQNLESMEVSDPALAAKLQELIEVHCKQYPFSYE